MQISWWDRNIKIRYKCLVVIYDFISCIDTSTKWVYSLILFTAVCHRGCANGGECIEPEVCDCVDPYVGVTCRENKQGSVYTLSYGKTQFQYSSHWPQRMWIDDNEKIGLGHQKVDACSNSSAIAGLDDCGVERADNFINQSPHLMAGLSFRVLCGDHHTRKKTQPSCCHSRLKTLTLTVTRLDKLILTTSYLGIAQRRNCNFEMSWKLSQLYSARLKVTTIHRVKWRHISVVAMRSPFCRSTRRTVCS